MLLDYKRGQGSIVLRFKLIDSSLWPMQGKTGLTESSAGLIIATIADNESATTRYRGSSSEIETISTLGTFAAPTSGKCRFKEVDATNHPGIYEVQLADARFAVSSAKSLLISISGASGLAQCDGLVPLRDIDPYDGVRHGMTALPNAAAAASGGLPTLDAAQGSGGVIPANAKQLGSVAFTVQTGSVATDAGNSATSFKTDLSSSVNDFWKDTFLVLTSGTLAAQVKKVTGYNGTTKIITVSGGFTSTPADGVTFILVNR